MTVGTLRTSVAMFSLFFSLTLAFILLATGYYYGGDSNLIKAGGVFGLMAAFLAWYNAMAQIWNVGNAFITLPLGRFPWAG